MKKLQLSLGFCILIVCILFAEKAFAQTTINSEGFESGLGIWSLSGNSTRFDNSSTSCVGNRSIRLRQNGSATMTSSTMNLSSYTQVDISFCHKANNNVDNGEGVNLEYYNGSSWTTLQQYRRGTEFTTTGNGNSHSFSYSLTSGLNSNARFRIANNTNNNNERNYIDNVEIIGYSGGTSYCPSYGDTAYNTGITNVNFNTINNADGSPKDNSYEDFTSISTNVTQSSTYTLNVNVDTDGAYYVYAYAWIDWNQDGDFTDPGETYNLGNAYNVSNGTTSNTPSITIPATAALGATRMRVSARYNNYPSSSCQTNFDGEVEDYTINVTGGAAAPEINIQGNSNTIVDGDTTPNTTDDTDFGNVNVAGGTNANTFTIQNTGTASLTLSGSSPYVTITGTHAADFTVTTIPSASIAASSSTTFAITFNPSAVGIRTATVSIANNDSNENPYNFNIQGNGIVTVPEINIRGNGTNITNGDITPSTADDTDFGNIAVASGTNANTFTIQNTGTASLTLTGGAPYVTISGAHASDFTLTANPNSTIASGSSTTFTITFDPSALGIRSATVSINNDDSDENPYTFSIQGTGITASYCTSYGDTAYNTGITNVNFNTINNADGSPKDNSYEDFTSISTNVTQSSTYTLNVNVDTDGSYYVYAYAWIDWNQDGDFTDTGETYNLGNAYNVSNGTTSITPSITIPATAALGATRMRISARYNNYPSSSCQTNFDGEVEDYTINVTSAAPLPEINIQGNSNTITDENTTPNTTNDTDFGSTDITVGTITNTFTIQNTGTGTLNLTGGSPYVYITGVNAADFTVTATPASTINSGGSTTFNITFNPSALGLRSATVSISNNDNDENPYNFSIQGTGTTTAPEIDILGNGNSITNGDTSPSNVDDTDFGSVLVTSGTSANTFTIENYGTLNNLNLTGGSPYVVISGANAADFSVTAIPSTPIAANSSTNFTITFDPSGLGTRTATLTIANNDTNENPYTFNIRGTGTNVTGPGGVTSGLQLWLKGTSGLSYTDGQAVSVWQDQGNASDAVAPVAGVEPTYKDNATDNLNFNPVVDFDNDYVGVGVDGDYSFDNTSTQFLQGTSGFYSQDIFVVLIPDATVNSTFGSMDVFCGDENPGTNEPDGTGLGFGQYTSRFNGEIISYAHGTAGFGNGYGVAEIGTGNSYNTPSIFNIRNNSSASRQELYHNATNIETHQNDVGDFANINNSRYWIGRSEGWEASTNARIAEIITFSSRKNDADQTQERNRIQSYLALKYGITLGVNGVAQDYVNSDGTVIWDQSNNSGYNHDIAGIGRDDNSNLIQKQSSSINNATDGTGQTEGILTIGLSDIYTTNNQNINNNPTALNDKEFLIWGNNGVNLNLAASTINVDMSAGIFGLSTPVTFTGMQRIWKVVEYGGDVPSVKLRIPENAVRNITPPGSFLMFISNTPVFDPTADYTIMSSDGNGNLETDYNFDGTKYITFGYAPEVVVERSVYFDGTSDYIDVDDALDLNTTEFTVSAWIKRDTGSVNGSIISKRNAANSEGYDLRINASGIIEFSLNGNSAIVTSSVTLPENEWHQVAVIYNGGNATLYIDGVPDTTTTSLPAPIATNQSFLIAAADGYDPNTTNFFAGNIDEVRVWNIALSVNQLRYIMNQEIIENSTLADGRIIPQSITKNEISSIPWASLSGYYPMSVYTYTNTNDMSGNNNQGALRNLDTVDRQTAPLPYETRSSGDWTTNSTWLNNDVQALPNAPCLVASTPIGWNIVEINHDVTIGDYTSLGREITVQSLTVNSGSNLQINGDTAANTGNGLTVSHYLKLDGTIDLEGESQLIQSEGSDFDTASTGSIERDQQGKSNTYVYNYWSSPVAPTSNSNYSVSNIFSGLNFLTSGYNGSTSPVSIADYWIWKYTNRPSSTYSAWQHVRSNGILSPGEGFTMKGTGAPGAYQNYVFTGQPNNGDINRPISTGNDYLIGNPYPSAIDANEFILDNIGTVDGGRNTNGNIINGALYFWDHFAVNSHYLADYQGGYSTYTLMGGTVAISNDTRINATGAMGTSEPERYIPVGQGFFVSAILDPSLVGLTQPINGGDIEFKNSQRIFKKENITATNSGSVFLKSKGKKQSNQFNKTSNGIDQREKIKLIFESPNGYYRQLLVGVDQTTSNKFDLGYDAPLIETNKEDIYWTFDNNKFIIQAVNNFDEAQVLPLGTQIDKEGLATFRIDELINLDDNSNIFLHDKELNVYHNLKESNYETFITAGEHLERFELTFSTSSLLSNEEFTNENLQVFFSNEKESIILLNPTIRDIDSIELYNIIGQSIYKFNTSTNVNYLELKTMNLNAGTYVIKMKTEGKTISKKVLVE